MILRSKEIKQGTNSLTSRKAYRSIYKALKQMLAIIHEWRKYGTVGQDFWKRFLSAKHGGGWGNLALHTLGAAFSLQMFPLCWKKKQFCNFCVSVK